MYENNQWHNSGDEDRQDAIQVLISGTETCEDARQECDCGESIAPVQQYDLEELTLEERWSLVESMKQEIELLIQRIPGLLGDIAAMSTLAQQSFEESGQYTDGLGTLEDLQQQTSELERIKVDIPAIQAEIERVTPPPCCEKALADARKYCGTCGHKVEQTGRECGKCSARNHEDCVYCYNCKALLNEANEVIEIVFGGAEESVVETEYNEEEQYTDNEEEAADYPGSF